MERNKMEQEFKDKLNQREIAPTPHAWDRLEAMLNDAEDKKPVRRVNWLYIAAGFIGIMFVGTMFFRNEIANNTKVAVEDVKTAPAGSGAVNTPADSVNDVTQPVITNTPAPQQVIFQKHQSEVALSQPKPKTAAEAGEQRKNSIQNPQQQDSQLAQVQKQNPGSAQEANIQNQKIINQSIPLNAGADEQLASIDTKLQNPKTIKVDPNSLLSQVDGELELSFREKVIKIASKKYKNVKVALANRNQQ
ncbi:MAG: hypothetical protein EOO48_10195 [Flavobacterium sp.]|nr:MAG: hypothetical protein EOO48_10195 [Flavobacterium sp.]